LVTQQAFFISGFDQFVYQPCGGGEAYPKPLLAGGQAQRQADVGLARSRRA
jgi:hypothetical protein